MKNQEILEKHLHEVIDASLKKTGVLPTFSLEMNSKQEIDIFYATATDPGEATYELIIHLAQAIKSNETIAAAYCVPSKSERAKNTCTVHTFIESVESLANSKFHTFTKSFFGSWKRGIVITVPQSEKAVLFGH
jgi:hypothetical protein